MLHPDGLSFISILHQTTTIVGCDFGYGLLSFISILHQTTTQNLSAVTVGNCLLSLFYIKPQLNGHSRKAVRYCLLSLFYIKPQQPIDLMSDHPLSFISILHQTTTSTRRHQEPLNCLLSLFYIKPQHEVTYQYEDMIVFYLYSTSNHNSLALFESAAKIVFYLYSTSNHNVYFLILLFTDICVHSYVHEVVKTYHLLCKITKKILTAMGLALIFSLWLPKCE